jgi:hypothetical protein
MRSFVITIPRLKDRLDAFMADPFRPADVEVFQGIDAANLGHFPARWNHPKGGFALNLTYIALFMQMIRECQKEPFMVFEDDALCSKNFMPQAITALAEAPMDKAVEWWSINLGPHVGEPGDYKNPTVVSKNLVRLHHAWRTQGVIYNPLFLAPLIDLIGEVGGPCDQIYCNRMMKGWQCFYATKRLLVGARANVSSNNGQVWEDFTGPFGFGGPIHASVNRTS